MPKSRKNASRGANQITIHLDPIRHQDEAAPAGSQLALRVQDSGIGIPSDKHEAIFRPFIQVEQSLSRPHGGAGLGLPLSKRLARCLGGELILEYSVTGLGSTFTLYLGSLSGGRCTVKPSAPLAIDVDRGEILF